MSPLHFIYIYHLHVADVPNGCDPATAIGGFLLFPALRAWCEEQGATEFGVYGRK